MKTRILLLFVCISLIIGNISNLSAQVNLSPTDDAYVRGGTYASTNYGSDASLIVKQGSDASFFRKFYLKFNLSAAGITTCSSAKVRLYANSTSTFPVTAYQVTDSWSESTITWTNAPTLGTSIVSVPVSTSGQYYEWDITSYVQSQLSGDGVVSVGFFDASAANLQTTFNSQEAASNLPQLQITTTSTNTYYIDSQSGNDSNTGLSSDKAWKSLTKVNNTTFRAGERILFKAGGVWTGRLYPKGSGSSGNPIVIDMYGSGNKPLIDGNGMTGTGVVYLYNQQYWEINNLEITNDAASGGDRRGVRVEVENWGVANHIYLRNLNIHNIKGLVGQERSNKRTAGIGFATVSASTTTSRFNDILVEGCVIHSCENQGIITECVANDSYYPGTAEWNKIKITNAVIRNNTIYNISKNAMIIRLFDGGVVEHNVCYNTANGITGNTIFSCSCDGTVFQYNEGYQNNSPSYDGSLYDADLRSPRTVWQYSYSHDNSHGLFWTCTVQEDVDLICRYNISQNDKGNIFSFCYPFNSVYCYNNTVFCRSTTSPTIINEATANGGKRTYYFYNNIIFNNSTSAKYVFNSSSSRNIDYNVFYGQHPSNEPADAHKITSNPMIVSPGSGGTGINSVSGYKLKPGSPCINSGKVISNNGGKDYWGNILYNGAPDRGAHEYYTDKSSVMTIETTNAEETNGEIKLFPNPNDGEILNLEFIDCHKTSNVTVSIADLQGRVVYNNQYIAADKIEIPINNYLKKSIYLVSVRTDNYNKVFRLVVK